ncbi:MAG: hypothetical protein JWM27_943 [Gemmatimonadetes bacterium]|nr:hypothetical protein [Gemmatimonadota bacterium]
MLPIRPRRFLRSAAPLVVLAAAGACGGLRPVKAVGALPCTVDSPSAPEVWGVDGGRVTGTVHDAAGAAIAMGRVLLTPAGPPPPRFSSGNIGAGGAFAIDSVAPGTYAAHVVGPPPYAPLDRTVRVQRGAAPAAIVLGRGTACR